MIREFHRHEQHKDCSDDEKPLEENRQPVLDEHAVEGGAGGAMAQVQDQQHSQRRRRGVAKQAPTFGGHPKIREHQHEAEGDHPDFQIEQGCVHFGSVAADVSRL